MPIESEYSANIYRYLNINLNCFLKPLIGSKILVENNISMQHQSAQIKIVGHQNICEVFVLNVKTSSQAKTKKKTRFS